MKLGGKKIEGANYEYVVLPRPGGQLVFKAQAVLDMKRFDEMCPEPEAPSVMKPGGVKYKNIADPVYLESLKRRTQMRINWMVLQSLSATEGLEWETVDMSNPDTFQNYEKELVDAGLTQSERNRIVNAVLSANGLDESKIEEARQSFLASLQMQEASS